MLKVHLIAAARPNFMKIAPLYHALEKREWCEARIVHTGQHYDLNMSGGFFRDLRLPEPAIRLGVGSGTHAEQTAGVMLAYDQAAVADKPDVIVVVGDVNSTVGCALVGAKRGIPVVHLEAGLRSGDRRMPEEINRLVTDAVADVLWTPSPDANANLMAEGVPASKIDLVGNIMIDSFEMMRTEIERDSTRQSLGLPAGGYAVTTLHRPSNVDDRQVLAAIVAQLVAVARTMRLVFPLHPRTRKMLEEYALMPVLASNAQVTLTEPLGYVQFMNLVCSARAVITDSGGVQEETTYLGIPCMTMRENTERPITISEGTNRLVAVGELVAAINEILQGRWPVGRKPALWDGRTAPRCADSLSRRFARAQ
jgi:UDP-N-acetylglucosamine 2-epimerase (non-hydrolysing)